MVDVRFSCGIEQLVNLLAQIGNEPELLATNQIQIIGSTAKEKVLQVRLGLSGVVRKKNAQEKKIGGGLLTANSSCWTFCLPACWSGAAFNGANTTLPPKR